MFTSSQHVPERNQDATIYVGNLTATVTEELLWELFLQAGHPNNLALKKNASYSSVTLVSLNAGPVVNVHIPKDKVTNIHQVEGNDFMILFKSCQ
jgi:splicing factor 3B subunit 4